MVDVITLYESTEMAFDTNGLGSLSEATKCNVKEERNGSYELEMVYPINGKRYNDIKLRRIILAKPNPYTRSQPFRIYNITKPINGLVTIRAEHVRYDLSGYPVSDIISNRASQALSLMVNSTPVPCPFTTWSDRTQNGTFIVTTPQSILSRLGGNEGSVLDVFGGEYEFDRFEIKLHKARGKNRGVSIDYGKNLTDLTQEENCSNVYTGVYPFWVGTDENGSNVMVELPNKIVYVEGKFSFSRILILDVSSDFESMPTKQQLEARAKKYINDNNIGIPKIDLKVSFVQLTQSEEYADFEMLEQVQLCDTVRVSFPLLGVEATAKVISTDFDAISGKYNSITLGDEKPTNFIESIATAEKKLEDQVTLTQVEQVANHTAKLINGAFGGNVMLNYLDGSDKPYEILIMDTDNIKTARKIWRWNQGGLAYSNSGYEGPWIVGMNALGEINGALIAADSINGNSIESGSIDVAALRGAENIVNRWEIENFMNYAEQGQLWLKFDMKDNTGLWIGRIDSQFLVNVTNERMAFVQNDKYAQAIQLGSNPASLAPYWLSTDEYDGKALFLTKVNSDPGHYEFTADIVDGSPIWKDNNGFSVNLRDYGIGYRGRPAKDDIIRVDLYDDYKTGRVVAYISNNKLLIKDAHIKESLSFGKDEEPPTSEVIVGADLSNIAYTDETGVQFITAVSNAVGAYDFVYVDQGNPTWDDMDDRTWDDLGNMTWDDLGRKYWTLNNAEVRTSFDEQTDITTFLDYGFTVEGTPSAGDRLRITYSAIPVANFAFIPNKNGSLKFKWVGPSEPET